MKTAYRTDIGRIRLINEDRCVVYNDFNGLLLAIVADGMGGHQAGDVASQMAVEGIALNLRESLIDSMTIEQRKSAVREAIEKTNRTIYQLACSSEQYHGMGTTVVVALADPVSAVIAHIGDSRAYMVNKLGLTQLTQDHSLVNELVRLGQISTEEASVHPRRNWLTRALGTEAVIDVELNDYSWSDKDMILICSDGLSGHVDDSTIWQLLQNEENIEHKVQALINEALESGGDDNITAVLLANDADSACEKGDEDQ